MTDANKRGSANRRRINSQDQKKKQNASTPNKAEVSKKPGRAGNRGLTARNCPVTALISHHVLILLSSRKVSAALDSPASATDGEK